MLKIVFDKSDLITCIPLAVMIILTAVNGLDLSGITFYPTIYRTTQEYQFNINLTGSPLLDGLIALVAGLFTINVSVVKRLRFWTLIISPFLVFTCIMLTLYLNKSTLSIAGLVLLLSIVALTRIKDPSSNSTLLRPVNKSVLVFVLGVAFFLLEVTSIVRWAIYPIFPSTIFGNWTWSPAYVESSLFYVAGLLSPYVMLVLLFSFLLKVKAVGRVKDLLTRKLTGLRTFRILSTSTEHSRLVSNTDKMENLNRNQNHRFLLAASLILSIVFAVYPYLPSINPDNFLIGYDLHYYIEWVEQLQHTNAGDSVGMLFTNFHKGDRPITVLFISVIQSLTNLPIGTVVQFLPLILGPALVFVIYYFVKYGTGNNKLVAAIAAMMTVVSYYFIVGMYSGFLANWMALIMVFLSLLVLLRTFEKPTTVGYLLFTLTTITTLFIHVYTWSYFISGITLYLILSYVVLRKDRQKLERIFFFAMIIGINIVVDLIRSHYTVSTGGIESTSMLALSGLSLNNLSLLWKNLDWNFTTFVGGYFTNFVMLALALVWTLSAKFTRNFDRLLLSTLYVGIVPVLFGDYVIQTRIFYNIPVHIPAALALYRLIGNRFTDNVNPRFSKISYKIFFYAIILHLLNYAFRAIANYYMT